ncbi:NAD(P)-binding domain-containing protein [Jannaschia sp. KMU-145]|uniref:NAD(P)-binding domain-containing protein n=1 Tax=Jannaschia halovivens TaxID=3388667 RepID=UPI00396B2F8B
MPLALVWVVFVVLRQRGERTAQTQKEEAQAAGLTQPASLHPVIDPTTCIGCGACVRACPEGRILGLVNGKAELVEPANCIGHGACAQACPMDAISLVFGTAERGMDIPHVGPDFQTNVPGIYIAGELGGMGLIRNAIEQGRQALGEIAKHKAPAAPGAVDVVIVGAGPAGFAAGLGAMEKGLSYVVVEQETLGGTVSHFPRGKLVMTAPVTLPIYGKANFRETTKEALMEFWETVVADTGLQINFEERVTAIEPDGDGFEVTTTAGTHRGRAVLLTIGRRGTPRKLGVEGEEQSKVVYRLTDPEQYQGQSVLVVGGGDSAIEAATSIAELPQSDVTLSYRSAAFSRVKPKNRKKLEAAEADGSLKVILGSNVKKIDAAHVEIEQAGDMTRLSNDAVIVCAGGILPTAFLKSIGITVETKHGTA